jgi:hypothetical protein
MSGILRDEARANAYAIIVFKAPAGKIRRLGFDDPIDALLGAIDYLRKGYQVRLNDAAIAALATDSAHGEMVARLAATARLALPAVHS